MLMEEQRAHLQKFSKNRKKESGKTNEQRFANVGDVAVPILAVMIFAGGRVLVEREEAPYVRLVLGNLDHSVL
jgi:hypothetical protein